MSIAEPLEFPPPPVNRESLELAYEFVRPSYDLAEKRYNAVEARIQAVTGFVAGAALGAPVFAKAVIPSATTIDYASVFWVAISLAALNIAAGALLRTLGELKLLSPDTLSKHYLDCEPDEFRQLILDAAGTDWKENKRTINLKGHGATGMTWAFFVQVALLVYWLTTQLH